MAIKTTIRKFNETSDDKEIFGTDDAQGITIEIPDAYFDTGHHYKIIPLKETDIAKATEVRKLALSQKHKW